MSLVAVVLAAGAGTRMKSAKPKVIHEVLGVPMVRLVAESLQQAGADQVIAIVSYEEEQVKAVLPAGVTPVHQDSPIGTANAVLTAEPAVTATQGSLVVIAGDTPLITPETVRSLVEHRESHGAEMAVLTAVVEDPTGYGRIIRDVTGQVVAIVEHRDATEEQLAIHEVNTGIYCFKIDGLWAHLEHIGNDNVQGEFYLTDIVSIILAEDGRVVAIPVSDASEVMGVNNRLQLAEAGRVLQSRINSRLMIDGVTMVAPDLTWVSPHATIAADVTIFPNTSIMGASTVATGAVLGPDTRLIDAAIGERAVVDSSIVRESTVGEGADIGPRAYIRPGCTIGADAKVGTSVEVKKSTVGANTKIPHLSYIGDAEIGEDSNLGAGTITCNYDGFRKSKTVIGDCTLIGSNTMLVAPVEVGRGAATGAGSVIAEDVPADALAVERSEQRIIEGWAATKRAKYGNGKCSENSEA